MTLEKLEAAHEQGFLSDTDFEQRRAGLLGQKKDKGGTMQSWLVGLFVKAIAGGSSGQDRLDLLAWLALVREVLADGGLSQLDKLKQLYGLMDLGRIAGGVFDGVVSAVKGYADADLPLAVKWAIPATLAAAAVVGGEAVGIAGFGGAVGLPVLLLVFVGVAGVTAILQAFLGGNAQADSYIGVVMALIAQDELLRQTNKVVREAMQAEPVAPHKQDLSKNMEVLRAELLALSPYDFERHVMSFFQAQGLLAWVTKQSNDAGVDGFARHGNGLVVVQCKRYAPENLVGSPAVQQFKGVVEENQAWRGYIVTTSAFSHLAVASAGKSDKLVLVDMSMLLDWHERGLSV